DHIAAPDNIQLRVIDEVTPVFFVRAGHPLAVQARVTLHDLPPWKLAHIRAAQPFVDWVCSAVGASAMPSGFQCDDFDILGEIVETSDMVSYASPNVISWLQRRHAVVPLEIAGIDYRHRIHCAQPAGRPLSRPAQKVLALIEAAFGGDVAR
ncbi:MAG: LysR substrate-binding domain-containing protein, partial [Polymorphobacter sp.]